MTPEIQKLIEDGRDGVTLGNEERLADALEVAVAALAELFAGPSNGTIYGYPRRCEIALEEIQKIAEQ